MKRIPLLGAFVAAAVWLAAAALAGPTPGEPAQGLYLFDPASGGLTLVLAGEEDDPAWSPDGRSLVAFDTNDYIFNVVDTAGGSRRRVDSLAWSDNGSRVAYTAGGKLFVARADWSSPRIVTRAAGSDAIAWAPDGNRLLYGTGRQHCCWRSLAVASADGRSSRVLLTGTGNGVDYASWSPTGQSIAVVGYDTSIYIVAAKGGPVRRLPGRYQGWPAPRWSADGRSLFIYPTRGVSSTGGFDAAKVAVAGGSQQPACKNCPAFEPSPDGRRLAFIDSNHSLWVENVDGTRKRLVAKLVRGFSWSSDGQRLVLARPGADAGTTALAVADLASGDTRLLTDHLDGEYLGLSPEGTFIAFARFIGDNPDSGDSESELWIAGSDGSGERKVTPFGTCSLVAWAPKGAQLAITNLDDC